MDIQNILASASARPDIMLPIVPGKQSMSDEEYAMNMSALVPLYDPGKGEGRSPLELLFATDYRASLRGHTSPYTGDVMQSDRDAVDHCFAMGYLWSKEDEAEAINKVEKRKAQARARTNKWREEHTPPAVLAARNAIKEAREAKQKAMDEWDAHIADLRNQLRAVNG